MTVEIIFIVTAVVVVARILCGDDLLFDHVGEPPRDDAKLPNRRDESEAA